MKPIIGVTMTMNKGQYAINEAYVKSIIQAGGIPLMIPLGVEEDALAIVDKIDGLLITGGVDVHPHFYNEEPHQHLGDVMLERDQVELKLTQVAFERKLPIFGICRGIQLLNIALGGTLYQDIPTQYKGSPILHQQKAKRGEVCHFIEIKQGSQLAKIVGKERVAVNSFHHQGLKDVPEIFTITAQSSDGMIEAIEMKDYPFCLGVQWHPEEMVLVNEGHSLQLFKAFIDACCRELVDTV